MTRHGSGDIQTASAAPESRKVVGGVFFGKEQDMGWIRPKEHNLAGYLAQDEIDAFRQLMGYSADGKAKDPVEIVLEDTATMVRGYCHVRMDEDPFTIPQSLLSSAMVVARYRILTRMQMDVNESPKVDYERAMEHLSLVAEGKVLVEPPSGAEDDTGRIIPLWGLSFRPNLLR